MSGIAILAIDGPSASGKGSVAQRVAEALGFAYLDSGALYRLTALAAQEAGIDWSDEQGLAQIAQSLDVRFEKDLTFLGGQDVSGLIRSEVVGAGASKVAAFAAVRQALLARQRNFAVAPGLVADGRDMGSVVFPGARLKIFLTATATVRAERRYQQLIARGESADLVAITRDLQSRDERDAARKEAPLRQWDDALLLETSQLSLDQVVECVLSWWKTRTET
ncbi:(d)CMP kinase [Iodobacter fluviatilis]|uniref:Cytidylate kinase n=1 Tax=Iodobacter fluviatilis TaxID=537 RepID=A0A377Q8L8_9NEIS|nr:(d)CMP kinase [Iodobacter fluviatilis]TCU88697.1 cytidylate kinase [Iodobacter fluviatilis]STQ91232.1 Cytidylate kinase [Iodobacter fluviatilis]